MARKFGINPTTTPKVESPLLKRFNEKPATGEKADPETRAPAKPGPTKQVSSSPAETGKPIGATRRLKETGQPQAIKKARARKTSREEVKVVRPTVPGGVPADQREAVEKMAKASGQELSNIVLAVTKRATAAIAANEDIDINLCNGVPEMVLVGSNKRISIPKPLLKAVQDKHDPLGLHTTIQTGTAIFAAYVRREIAALAVRLGVST